jgi:hypothetical protein
MKDEGLPVPDPVEEPGSVDDTEPEDEVEEEL